MAPAITLALLLLTLGSAAPVGNSSAAPSSAIAADMSPIRKVITLMEEMKAQCQKEADEDEAAFNKHKCWCETNDKEKTAAIKDGEEKIEELSAFVEEAAAKEGQLKTEIAGLAADIAEDQEALAAATALREKESAEFEAEEADMKETTAALAEAIQVLSKVQLLQSGRPNPVATTALIQVRNVIQRQYPKFHGVMQRDLYDVLSSLQDMVPRAFLTRRRPAALDQLLPWEKTEEQIGMEAKPNELKGLAANAKSYNSRSGRILGVLAEMRDEFTRDLSEAQKADFEALVAFQQLRSAKLSEIAAASAQKKQKEAALADLLDKAAKAKEDIEATKAAVDADQKFLVDLTKNCESEAQEYASRVEVRSEEIRALGEALKILTEDDARDLFGKTISFVQVRSASRRSATSVTAARDRAVQRAMERLAGVARRRHSLALASLAVRVRLDAFTKVKEMMDKMFAELQAQRKQEYEKKERCDQEIDKTEDKIKEREQTKEDLNEKHTGLVNTLSSLDSDIKALKAQIAELEVSLKQAGEQRKEENELYRASVSDQRATAQILKKTLARLKAFYEGESFAQADKPGEASSPEPPKGKAYKKSALGGGVIQLLMKIIKDAEVVEGELTLDEQHAEGLYETFAKDTATTIEANRDAIATKSEQVALASGEKSETEEAQLANDGDLANLGKQLDATHLECDWLLKYFDVRQTALAEEMDAITEAKAILSGSDFGGAEA